MIKIFGVDWIINRYTECAIAGAFIQSYAQEFNPGLAQKMMEKLPRKQDEVPANYEITAVPSDYLTTLYPGSTTWGYASSRILIEQFGREEEWKIGGERFEEGSHILETAISTSHTPIEFLVNLATLVAQPNGSADLIAVLGHLLAVELRNEGIYSQIRDIVQGLKAKSPHLWEFYLSLSIEDRKKAGILPIEVIEGRSLS